MSFSISKITIASDHAGYELKEYLKDVLSRENVQVNDLGTHSTDSVDYPDYAILLGQWISDHTGELGILVCGSGIGMSITVNRFPKVRGALCGDLYSAKMSRLHNDANVLVLGGRVIGKGLAEEMVRTWLNTEFEGGRHQRRVDKMTDIDTIPIKGES